MSKSFVDNPAEHFDYDYFAAHQLARDGVEKEQLAGLNRRFQDLKDKILPLSVLAESQNVTEIEALNDVLPLLFPHTLYKAYPEELLLTGQYDKMTKWLSRLTSVDLTDFAKENYQTMDDWMDFMDQQTDLEILHSSGTTGRLSFYPRSKMEIEARQSLLKMHLNDKFDQELRLRDRENAVIWTGHAGGRTSFLRDVPLIANAYTKSDDAFFPLIPALMSSDHHFFLLRCTNLMEQGVEAAPEPSDYVRMRIDEAKQIHADMPMLTERLLDIIAGLKYKMHVTLIGVPVRINDLVEAGLARGMENMFRPQSLIGMGGGFKNNPVIDNLISQIKRFAGPNMLFRGGYGMSELLSAFAACGAENYHLPPWVVAFVLDVETGQPRPRKGRQKGRFAFFDLLAQSHWGGIVTGDLVEIDWGQCGCGRNTPFIRPSISRLSDDSDPLSGEMDRKAWAAALTVLTENVT